MMIDHNTSVKDPLDSMVMLIVAMVIPRSLAGVTVSFSTIKPVTAVISGQTMYANAADLIITLFIA